MLSPEEKREMHRFETELLVEEEEKRHLVVEERRLTQEEHQLHNTLLRTETALHHNKAEKSRIKQLLNVSEESIQRLKIKLKGLRH